MPQQRRKVAFSGKKKKDQLLQKRQSKAPPSYLRSGVESYEDRDRPETSARKLQEQPSSGRNRNVNRYNLQFYQESKQDLEMQKAQGFEPLQMSALKEEEIDGRYFEGYDLPIRPPWKPGVDKATLDASENRYFRQYVEELEKAHRKNGKELSLFELNLETWRQLWRVLEFSDVLLIIVDVRYATLMFPPALYNYITNELEKHVILVFNKVDLVAPEVVVAWRHYFKSEYPNIPIVLFASYSTRAKQGGKANRNSYKRCMIGVHNIYRECHKFAHPNVDLAMWEQKIQEDMSYQDYLAEEDQTGDKNIAGELEISTSVDSTPHLHKKFRDGILTIGCIGFPNVGKSSLINALKGRKVVSVSRTPGHTKHFQTIFLTKSVRLCDCPGLVFPSCTPKCLQVLMGSYPISQLKVPYPSIKFLAEHLDVPHILKISLPVDYEEWTASAICEAWAIKRGFLTAKAARPDVYRAANHILRSCLVGQQQLVLQFYPPGYNAEKDIWSNHSDVTEVRKYQNLENVDEHVNNEETSSFCSDSTESESEDSNSNDETNIDGKEATHRNVIGPSGGRYAFDLLNDE